jgi:mannose-6-phosphate isomerase-like protein (cupin superfamily)
LSFTLSQPESGGHLSAPGDGLHIPATGGISRWVFGDTYTMKLTGELTNGSISLIEASVPAGGGPVPHTHANEDEIFYLQSGELEFVSGERAFTAGPGDVVFIPRTTVHRFRNPGIRPATMLFMYTPGGAEGIFIEGGDEPVAGQPAQMWGPERLPPLADLLVKYGIEVVP